MRILLKIIFSSLRTKFRARSVHHKDHSFSAPNISQFNTENPSVQHQKPFSSTPKAHQFNTPLTSTSKKFVELRGFRYWTKGYLVLNWGMLGAEKEWPFCVELMCWTEGCGTEGDSLRIHDFRIKRRRSH